MDYAFRRTPCYIKFVFLNSLGFSVEWDDGSLKQSTRKNSVYTYEGLPKTEIQSKVTGVTGSERCLVQKMDGWLDGTASFISNTFSFIF